MFQTNRFLYDLCKSLTNMASPFETPLLFSLILSHALIQANYKKMRVNGSDPMTAAASSRRTVTHFYTTLFKFQAAATNSRHSSVNLPPKEAATAGFLTTLIKQLRFTS